ncbi:MAG: hypothetical protein ACPL3C_06020 [Pyrobaculum sp.]
MSGSEKEAPRQIGLMFGRFPVALGPFNECVARYRGAVPDFSYVASPRALECWTPCFYFPVPYYFVVLNTVGEYDVDSVFPKLHRRTWAMVSMQMAMKLVNYSRDYARFALDRAFRLASGSLDPRAEGYDERVVSVALRVLQNSRVATPPVRFC